MVVLGEEHVEELVAHQHAQADGHLYTYVCVFV